MASAGRSAGAVEVAPDRMGRPLTGARAPARLRPDLVALQATLLALGGSRFESAVWLNRWAPRALVTALLARGVLFDARRVQVRLQRGAPNRCHENADRAA